MILKILILIWLYLSVGYGFLLINQVLGYKHPNSDIFAAYDPDDEDDSSAIAAVILVWPLILGIAVVYAFCLLIKHNLKLLNQDLSEENDKWPKN